MVARPLRLPVFADKAAFGRDMKGKHFFLDVSACGCVEVHHQGSYFFKKYNYMLVCTSIYKGGALSYV